MKKIDLPRDIPKSPGVYQFYNDQHEVVYVGKAKNLRRRLGQYKNAKRCKKHKKMLEIMRSATEVKFSLCANALEAELLENKLIQELSPRWNVAGAFAHLYPMIGLYFNSNKLLLCCTTHPDRYSEFTFYGAFRSIQWVRESFKSLSQLLSWVAHPLHKREFYPRDRFTLVCGFSGVTEEWVCLLKQFLKGESRAALEELVLSLTEDTRARSRSKKVQAHLNWLKWFWHHEAIKLKKAIDAVPRSVEGQSDYPVSQKKRDSLFIQYRVQSSL